MNIKAPFIWILLSRGVCFIWKANNDDNPATENQVSSYVAGIMICALLGVHLNNSHSRALSPGDEEVKDLLASGESMA